MGQGWRKVALRYRTAVIAVGLTHALPPPLQWGWEGHRSLLFITAILISALYDGQEELIDKDVRAVPFRAVREALVDVLKHARERSVTLRVQRVGMEGP